MKKIFGKKGVFDKTFRNIDANVSSAIGLEDGAKISHAFKPDSLHHKDTMKYLKGEEKQQHFAAPDQSLPTESSQACQPEIALPLDSTEKEYEAYSLQEESLQQDISSATTKQTPAPANEVEEVSAKALPLDNISTEYLTKLLHEELRLPAHSLQILHRFLCEQNFDAHTSDCTSIRELLVNQDTEELLVALQGDVIDNASF